MNKGIASKVKFTEKTVAKTEEKTLLLFPAIKIQDCIWLRNAILYWDYVASIVPRDNYSSTTSIDTEYLKDAGIYQPIYAYDLYDNADLCKKFFSEVQRNLRQCKVEKRKKKDSPLYVNKLFMPDDSRVHLDEIPDNMRTYLLDKRIAYSDSDGIWLNMQETAANVYMATLAKYLSKMNGNTEIGTDLSKNFLYPYTPGIPKRNADNLNRQIYVDVAIQDILPIHHPDVTIPEVIAFRKSHGEQLGYFRRRVEQFQWNLRACETIEEVQYKIETFRQEIEVDLRNLEKTIGSRKLDKKRKALRMLIPIGMQSGISMLEQKGWMSSVATVMASSATGMGAQLLCAEKEPHMTEKITYLFCEQENGLIRSGR